MLDENYNRRKVERLTINYLNCILILFYLWLMINQNALMRESVCVWRSFLNLLAA